MEKEKLIEYLERVVELEKQVYLQKRTLAALDSEIRSLGISKQYNAPTRKYNDHGVELSDLPGALGGGALIGGVVGLIISIVSCNKSCGLMHWMI